MSNKQPVTRNSNKYKVFFTHDGTEYELPNIENINPPNLTRGSRDVNAFQNEPYTIRKPSWITPEDMTVNMYWNPSHPSVRALQKLWGTAATVPIRVQESRAVITSETKWRLSAAGEVTFAADKGGAGEEKFDYNSFAAGIGHAWVTGTGAAEKIYIIKSFDATGQYSSVDLWTAGSIAAVATDTAASLVVPKVEIRFGGYLAGDNRSLDNDAEAMSEVTFGVSSAIDTYIEGVKV